MNKNVWMIIFLIILVASPLILHVSTDDFNLIRSQHSQNSSSIDSLEVFLKQSWITTEIAEAYRFALENPRGVLTKVKCYCGCLTQDHQNNRDCFINDDGSFDQMGLNCGLCVKTALLSKQLLSEGKTVQDISDYVDSRWGKIN